MSILFGGLARSSQRFAVLLILGFLLVGCGSTSPVSISPTGSSTPTLSAVRAVSTDATTTYLGAVNGTQALLGLVLDGSKVRAYVCDGTPSSLATLAEWFAGQVKGSEVQASSQDQQAQFTAQLTRQSASGTLRLASGRVYAFSIPQVSATAQVGVFEGTALIVGKRYHAGWLVLPDGNQRGAASFYPQGPVRGGLVIALLPAFPQGPIRG